jgi:hypothetical protein
MCIDASSSLEHGRLGFDADNSQAAHAAVLHAGVNQGT